MNLSRFIKCFCLTIAVVSAYALAAPMSGYAADEGIRVEQSRFLPSTPKQTEISFVRKKDLAPGQFALRISFPVATSGCAQFNNPYYETAIQSPLMTVNIEPPVLINDSKARYAHYECDTSMKMPSTDIYFSKEHILSNGITTIALQDQMHKLRKDFTLNLNESFVEFVPASSHDRSLDIFRPQDLTYNTNAMKYWFYPDNTVILYVPMAEHGSDLSREVHRFARQKALVPLEEKLPGFRKPITKPNHFYFVANRDMDISENGHKLGVVKATKTEYGLLDDETVEIQLDVFAKKPGLYE